MGRNELITNISQKTGITKVDCEKMLDAFTDTVKDSLVNGDKIIIKGFMSMEATDKTTNQDKKKSKNWESRYISSRKDCKV